MKEHELESIGFEVVSMLKSDKFDDIAAQYGYALRYDRDANEVIEEDFRTALNECSGSMQNSNIAVSISHFEENDTGLESLIECDIQLEQSSGILVELILNTKGTIYLEQISSYRTEHHA